ncbi:DPP IV N-terminal domain-containing protein [Hymenobacter caeli]|uniref:Dipeptidyl aminopeptidase/acylaminoacyl peptidase n=1 Tax=Hymenobacter caeli TaxID=2735894 RepID=A0ABX2FS58_9BACT|nr:DPP IV N-terminal domain-containing protein [Hymenobacter caeli]NRT20025.1 dipeptidyl aminopeptidase/acylaminoacyl peptidase [Hymenobacter caeli]
MHKYFLVLLTATAFLVSATASAQQLPALTAKDYARAEGFLGYNTLPLVDRSMGAPTWLAGDRFWYRVLTPQGSEFVLVDPVRKTKTAAFDPAKLAASLGTASGKPYEAARLPFRTFTFSPDEKQLLFATGDKNWQYEVASGQVSADPIPALSASAVASALNEVASPDGRRVAFLRDYNLWVRDTKTKAETALTTDGIKDYGYATDNSGYATTDKPVLLWSPDSRKIATFRQDQRQVSDMYLVTTNVGQPTLKTWKYPYVGDQNVISIERVILEVDQPKVVHLQLAPDPRGNTGCLNLACEGRMGDVEWSPDATQLAFVSSSRDSKRVNFRVADAATGRVREVFSETVPTFFESGREVTNWRYLPKTKEVIWCSARDNWGHLYLYDAATGKLKHQITKGSWAVRRLVRVDEKARQLYFLASGREQVNPYFTYLYRIGMDGKHLTLLTPEAGNHAATFAPSGRYFIDNYSQYNAPPISLLRAPDGRVVLPLEKADISRLTAIGWKPPTPIMVKAQDGQFDLYGLMYTPSTLDPGRKYPVVNLVYPGPQYGTVSATGGWSFAAARGDNQALAELGFVVVLIEGSCNPYRSKSFQDACYGNPAENTLSDQVTGLRQLAQKYPYLDLNRVGIWGHSGGGYAAAAAMFRYPDFYKVGISESGNHDQRSYISGWGERYVGLLTPQADGTSNYSAQANAPLAKNLKGKLLLAHGLMDNNVPPYNTMLVVDALIKANKTFDLVVFPQAQHTYGPDAPYMTRRRWDYFVRNLAGMEPPQDYKMLPKTDPRDGAL